MPNMLINIASRQLAALHRYFSASGRLTGPLTPQSVTLPTLPRVEF